ncbi:unnamed protein product [Polarella glacialis]|uniref:Cupin type-1 domain-containing protein n=1 Tax=Polarella glacialis TaxID=89957 RepID=A0A813HRQ8_POLGL|nr:unnamed protein product [Polarella glacialis]
MTALAGLCISAFLVVLASSQFLPPGTVDVPVPRGGDCGGEGPATYVYRLSSKEPNDFFPEVCPKLGGAEVHFNDPCAWAHGQAQMTSAHFTKMCKGATRTIHWHNTADEWGFVNKGQLMTFVASPDGLPWPSSYNVLSPRGVWYFPSGWLHGLMCMTPEEEGGCEFTILFASPQAAEPNGHNLDTTMAQAPNEVAAPALHIKDGSFAASRGAFAKAEHSIHFSNSNMTAPIVTQVARGACEPSCPSVHETLAAPAAVEADAVEQKVRLPGTDGVTLYRIRTDQFPFARTMSQERTELDAGATRPMVWASADAILVVVAGSVTVSLEGGLLGSEAHAVYKNETLAAGDIAYLPNGRAYWFQESTGENPAETITVFNVGNWKSFEMAQSIREMPMMAVMSNLHLEKWKAAADPIHI